jgi:hypothetical protein
MRVTQPDASPLYVDLGSREPMLRIGVMLDELTVPAWVEHVLSQVQASSIARIELLILNGERREPPTLPQRVSRLWRGSLFDRYMQWDQARFRRTGSPFEPRDASPLLSTVPRLVSNPIRRVHEHRFPEDELKAIRAAELDVLLRFGFRIIRGDILRAARYGVWSYHHGDNLRFRGGPCAFWEMYQACPETGVVLQRLTSRLGAGDVLARSWTASNLLSLELNRASNYWKGAAFVPRALRSLRAGTLQSQGEAPRPVGPVYRTPTNPQMIWFGARLLARRVRESLEYRLRDDIWFIAYRYADKPIDPGRPRLSDFRTIVPPPGHFYADPCAATVDGVDYIFIEDFIHAAGKGIIACMRVTAEGVDGDVVPVLESATHLSYPFVFEWNGTWWMIPEASSTNAVTLYRATAFPYHWEREADLLTGVHAVDTTLVMRNGNWYLFAGISECGGSTCDELFLFCATSPLGPWRPHPMNPLVSDVRRARPAGRLFCHEGRLIRPSQNCSRTYGGSLVFSEVLELTPERYRERRIGELMPDWYPGQTGCHTYSASGQLEVFDAKVRQTKFLHPFHVRWRRRSAGRVHVWPHSGQ